MLDACIIMFSVTISTVHAHSHNTKMYVHVTCMNNSFILSMNVNVTCIGVLSAIVTKFVHVICYCIAIEQSICTCYGKAVLLILIPKCLHMLLV